MNKLLGLLFLLVFINPVSGQLLNNKKKKGDSEYTAAVQAFKRENYSEAMSKFAALTKDYSNQERSVYSHYFYASAAERLNKNKEGLNMLQQLLNRFPNWNYKEEVYYLASQLNFKLKNYAKGIEYANRINLSGFQNDVSGLKVQYLSEVTDLGMLRALHKQFPNDRIVASFLVKGIYAHKSPAKSDLELASSLASRFNLTAGAGKSEETADEKMKIKSVDKEDKKHFDVAVLLPFRLDVFDASARSRANQYVFDYYQGLLMAQRQLKKEKVDVRLHPFDVGTEKAAVMRLTEDDVFLKSDIILGPLYPETSEVAAEYSRASGIPVINPLSTDAKLLTKEYPYYFLAHASIGLQARQIVHVAKGIERSIKAAVYYGESSKDQALAEAYKSEVEAEGGEVVIFKKIGSTSETIAPVMGQINEGSAKATHVVLFSTDPRTGKAFLNQMRSAGFERTPLIATATSFDRYNTDFSIYGRDIYLLDTDFVDNERQETKVFQHEYYQANNTLPSIYSYQGYDHLLFLGRSLQKYKSKVGDGIQQGSFAERQGYFLGGFDFRSGRENSVFTIRKYQGNSWVLAN